MYYEVNGKVVTLRGLFSSMPPMSHHREDSKSEVLNHIATTLKCSPQSARRAFDSMRQPKTAVLLFDGNNAAWHGCDWVPENETDSNRMMSRRLTNNSKKVEQFISGYRKMESMVQRALERMDEIEQMMNTLGERIERIEEALASGVELQEQPQETETVSQPKGQDTGTTGDPNDPYGFFAAMREPLTGDEQEPS